VALPTVTPIVPTRVREPFDHADWIFELKLDGFRALAYVEDGVGRLVSRRGHVYKAFGPLATAIAEVLKGHSATRCARFRTRVCVRCSTRSWRRFQDALRAPGNEQDASGTWGTRAARTLL